MTEQKKLHFFSPIYVKHFSTGWIIFIGYITEDYEVVEFMKHPIDSVINFNFIDKHKTHFYYYANKEKVYLEVNKTYLVSETTKLFITVEDLYWGQIETGKVEEHIGYLYTDGTISFGSERKDPEITVNVRKSLDYIYNPDMKVYY